MSVTRIKSDQTKVPTLSTASPCRVVGAVLDASTQERDIWGIRFESQLESMLESPEDEYVQGDSDDSIRAEISSRYPSTCAGTTRVGEREHLDYYDESESSSSYYTYRTLQTCRGFAVYKKSPLCYAVESVDDLRNMSLHEGSVTVPYHGLKEVILNHCKKDGSLGEKSYYSFDVQAELRKLGFTSSKVYGLVKVRFNPKGIKNSDALDKKALDWYDYEQRIKRYFEREDYKALGQALASAFVATTSDNKSLKRNNKSFLRRWSPRLPEVYSDESLLDALRVWAQIHGRRDRRYRTGAWSETLKRFLPRFEALSRSQYASVKDAYKSYRKQGYKASRAWGAAKGHEVEIELLRFLRTEFRVAKLKIPPYPTKPDFKKPKRPPKIKETSR